MAVLTARQIEILNNISPGADQVGLGNLMENALSGILPAGSVALSELAMAATGQVIRSNGVASPNTWSTISASAPVFTGSALGTHQHAAVTAGTPAGTVAAPVFTGTPHTLAGTVAAPVFTASAANYNSFDLYDIPGSTNTDSANADQASATLNGTVVAAAAAVALGNWTHGALTNPTVPRNVCITIENPTGGPLDLFEGVMTFHVVGTDAMGSAQTEDITLTSDLGNKTVATTKFRYVFGSKAWKTVTDITLDNKPADDFTIAAGIGSKISLLTPLRTPAEADILRATINVTNFNFSSKYDSANNTINFGSLSDGDDVHAVAMVSSGRTGTNSAPAFTGESYTPAGTNSAPVFTGAELATHQHAAISAGTPAGTVAAPVISLS
jgi:hypothetical protein